MDETGITEGLNTAVVGREVRVLTEVGSTNTVAMELAANGAPNGTVVVAERQTAGKGRLGRHWISPNGNLYFSVILRPEIPLRSAPAITLMGAVAVATAIRQATALPAAIKWPNDIQLAGKKVCGLLTELSAGQDGIRHVVLGIGIDVNMDMAQLPPELRPIATSLATEAGRIIDRTALLRAALQALDIWYARFLTDTGCVLAAWQGLNITTGRRVAVTGAGRQLEGLAERIDDEGRLLIRGDDGALHTVSAGDVTVLSSRNDISASL